MYPKFIENFWAKDVIDDRRSVPLLLQTTKSISDIIGVHDVLATLVSLMKSEQENVRKTAVVSVKMIISSPLIPIVELTNVGDILMDSLLFAFQEQTDCDLTISKTVAVFLKTIKWGASNLHSILGSLILWRLNNNVPTVRQLAAELAGSVADPLTLYGAENIVVKLGMVLFENLGEQYPDVLASVIGGLSSIIKSLGVSKVNPQTNEILPRLTPILRNRHEKVQENCIELIGLIAEKNPDAVNAKEWMRICFELLESLRAPKKSIRRSAVSTFGKIAKAIGPADVLVALLNNLKVQERQNRLCTTIAIAIVAENCGPFTVLPALMNEYRVPELNVQNGVLKALAFLFEYIGEASKDYIYSICPLLEDALTDRDLVHRQTACNIIKHASIGGASFGCEEAFIHLLNHVMPNIFETSPHVILSVIETLESLRFALGSGILSNYIFQGLFHPARRVREVYWRVYNCIYVASPEFAVYQYPKISSWNDDPQSLLDVSF